MGVKTFFSLRQNGYGDSLLYMESIYNLKDMTFNLIDIIKHVILRFQNQRI